MQHESTDVLKKGTSYLVPSHISSNAQRAYLAVIAQRPHGLIFLRQGCSRVVRRNATDACDKLLSPSPIDEPQLLSRIIRDEHCISCIPSNSEETESFQQFGRCTSMRMLLGAKQKPVVWIGVGVFEPETRKLQPE